MIKNYTCFYGASVNYGGRIHYQMNRAMTGGVNAFSRSVNAPKRATLRCRCPSLVDFDSDFSYFKPFLLFFFTQVTHKRHSFNHPFSCWHLSSVLIDYDFNIEEIFLYYIHAHTFYVYECKLNCVILIYHEIKIDFY